MTFTDIENNRINFKIGTHNRILSSFSEQEHYLETVWKYLSWEKVNLDNWKRKNEIPKEATNKIKEMEVIENRVKIRFPHLFLSSVYNSSYTIFESELGFINSFLKTHFDPSFIENDKQKLEKTKDNFEILKIILKTLKISLSHLNPEYDNLKLFKKLRDNIAHQSQQVLLSKPNDTRFRDFVAHLNGVETSEGMWVQEGSFQTFILTSDYPVKKFIESAVDFFSKLLELNYPSDTNKLWEFKKL